jgi:site-specific DNA-methyltransferase (adenine-specific)
MNEENFKIYNDDCFKRMEKLIEEGVHIDHIICDPPYNIDIADWDKNFDFKLVCGLAKRILGTSGNLILFQGWSEVCNTIQIFNNEFDLKNWVIWDRIKGRGSTKNFVSTREDILWYSNSENPIYHKMYSNIEKKTGGMGTKNGENTRALTNVWYDISPIVPWSDEKTEHPSQKPVELMERCVNIWTNPGDTILDFTMGTGTTGRAALNCGRKFIGIERDKKWFNIAKQRLSEEVIVENSEDTMEDYDF